MELPIPFFGHKPKDSKKNQTNDSGENQVIYHDQVTQNATTEAGANIAPEITKMGIPTAPEKVIPATESHPLDGKGFKEFIVDTSKQPEALNQTTNIKSTKTNPLGNIVDFAGRTRKVIINEVEGLNSDGASKFKYTSDEPVSIFKGFKERQQKRAKHFGVLLEEKAA